MNYKIKKYIRKTSNKFTFIKMIYIVISKVKVCIFSVFPDESYAKYIYHENTGRKLNLQYPTTFNDKLWWLKIHNRDPLLTKCSDKYEVRDYVRKKGLEGILVPLVGVYNNPEEIEFEKIPNKAFIKVNHASGINVIWDSNKTFNEKKFRHNFSKALRSNYFLKSREWNYKNIMPRIIIEEVIVDKSEMGLIDYRFLCFDGIVRLIFVDINTASIDGTHNPYAKRNIYDADFNHIEDVKVGREKFDFTLIEKPLNFEKMKKIAEILAEPFIFCRVDLYNIESRIYFGEITFYPGGGTQLIEPNEFEIEVGGWIDLNSPKIIKC